MVSFQVINNSKIKKFDKSKLTNKLEEHSKLVKFGIFEKSADRLAFSGYQYARYLWN